jgi:hypothetical protein
MSLFWLGAALIVVCLVWSKANSLIYPPVIKHGNWKSTINGAFNGKINDRLVIFHCHV